MITLPDKRFFDLARGILGNIQSPFNKQRLSDEFESFLSNKGIQKTIAAYIDGADHKMIAAVAALNGPDCRQLASFFRDEYSYAALDALVANLEERMILYVTNDRGIGRLFLNPLLKPALLPFVTYNGILFPSAAAVPEQQPRAVFDDMFLAAFITFIMPEKNIFKNDGTLRKSLTQKIQKIFPSGEAGGNVSAGDFAKALRRIGLLPDGSFGRAAEQKLREFALLTETERFACCAAGFYIDTTDDVAKILTPSKNLILHIASSAAKLLDSVDENKCYTVTALRRLAEVMLSGIGERAKTAPDVKPIDPAILIEALEKTGLLLKQNGGYSKRSTAKRSLCNIGRASENIPAIAFDSLSSFKLLPEITFGDAVRLAYFCEAVDAKQSVRFKITRGSAARGFNSGISGDSMFDLLKKLSGARADDSLQKLLADWEKSHSEIVVMDGISVVLSEERRYLARTEPLKSHIVYSPLPGVYMLDFEEKDEAAATLKKAGADTVCDLRITAKSALSVQQKTARFFTPFAPAAATLIEGSAERDPAPRRLTDSAFKPENPSPSAAEYKKHFRAVLDTLNFSRQEREELAARIERKLVVSTRQLNGAFARYEKREARGLDYAGKLALVKQSMLSNETLEIIFQDSGGTEKRVTGAPVTLEKAETETVLSVKPPQDGGSLTDKTDAVCMRIPMGKISVIRRIKQSVFSN
ncbi:MAG: hypothetical protein LBH50_02415 [Spirochaetaceae bacterium]|nr:hypothetical protein [Spirochaetaceae bacterium]